jgi:phosphopantothenoylcysteine decarboxylase/phosphopantothenate--cysteine ligase
MHVDNAHLDSPLDKQMAGKNIVIGITGGIAAYKAADLTRRLMEAGAEVRIVMTAAATEFVTPLTFQALSGHPVFFDNSDTSSDSRAENGMKHIELARWADAIVIAPASANTLAKLAHGRADNLLTTLCLASEAIKCFAPAMNRVMWQDAGTQANCSTLTERGWRQLGPDRGLQACGETGEGRMLEVADIVQSLLQCFNTGELRGVNVVISAGPTYEAIDPVRFIGNRSSGRMGYAIARAAKEAGARVTLVSGPSHLAPPDGIDVVAVESAEEMKQAVLSAMQTGHIFISTAAVSDYRVAHIAEQKIKKSADTLQLELVRNDDIVSLVTALPSHPYVVGFAAETENLAANARDKLIRKQLDMIVANDVSPGASAGGTEDIPAIGFNSEYNALHVFCKPHEDTGADTGNGEIREQQFDIARKSILGKQLIQLIAGEYRNSQSKTAMNAARISSGDSA